MDGLTVSICSVLIVLAVCGFAFIEAAGRIDDPRWDTVEWIVLGIGLLALMFIVGCAILG